MNDLISQIAQAAAATPTMAGPARLHEPASAVEVAQVETLLAGALPRLWRRVYLEVGNGGFGPGYGLTGLISGAKDDQGHSASDLYTSFRTPDPEDSSWRWPEGLLPVCHWGCAIQSCIDARDSHGRVVRFDPNGHGPDVGWEGAWWVEAPSAEAWWGAWLAGELTFEKGAA